MNAHARDDMVNRVFDAGFVRDVFRELDTRVRVSGLTPAAHNWAEREAIYGWMGGHGVKRTATLIADKLGASQ
jgi:hypothetical protein